MKEFKLVSIIVPVYNVENYLSKCVDSIINQTYRNLEIILVDDGSTDCSSKICDEYAKNDTRILVIHKANGGQSEARNIGISESKGEYIFFVDSDDYIEYNAIETMLEIAENKNVDMVIADIYSVNEKGEILNEGKGQYTFQNESLFSAEEAAQAFAELDWGPWNKLYKRSIHKDIYFPQGKIHEDEAIMFQLFERCDKIVYTNARLYNYLQREGSTTSAKYSLKKMDWFEVWLNNFKYVQEHFPSAEKKVMKKLMVTAIYNLDNLLNIKNIEAEKYIFQIRKELREYQQEILLNSCIKMNYKFRIILINISLPIYCKIFRIKGANIS